MFIHKMQNKHNQKSYVSSVHPSYETCFGTKDVENCYCTRLKHIAFKVNGPRERLNFTRLHKTFEYSWDEFLYLASSLIRNQTYFAI